MPRYVAILKDADGSEMRYRFLESDLEAARKRAINLADEAKLQFVSIAEEPQESEDE
jgi:hypothetical protein